MDSGLPVRNTLLTLNICMFLVMAGFGIIMPLLPYAARDMGASAMEMGLLITLFALTQFLFAPVWGNMSDRYGRRRILLFGMIGYGLTFFLMAMAKTVSMLLLARALSGILSAAAFPTAQAIVIDLTAPERRATAIGQLAAWMNMGFILGPMAGGFLAPLGMANVFWLSGLLALSTATVAVFILGDPPPSAMREHISLFSLLREVPGVARSPMGIYLFISLVASFGGAGVFSLFTYYLMDRIGATAAMTGYMFTAMGTGSAGVQYLLVGPAVRLIGMGRVIIISLVAGAGSFAVIALGGSFWILLFGSFLNGAALGMLRPVLMTAVSERTTHGQGFTMGLLASFDAVGRMLGPMWSGLVYGWAIVLPFWSAAAVFAVTALAAGTRRDDG